MRYCKTELKHGLFLAPMAGFTDSAFRHICRESGAEYVTTEMVSACAEWYADKKTDAIAAIGADEMPCAIQIFGSKPDIMAKAAYTLLRYKPTAIDINMGCPVPKMVKAGEGSALLLNLPLVSEIVREVVNAVDIPVTVKIRKSFSGEETAVETAKAVENSGASAICVHGRTAKMMYSGASDNDTIKRVKEAVTIPVIGNGDICTAADAIKMMDYTGCNGVAIGRGALGNPWIFREIACALDGKYFEAPTNEERYNVMRKHFELEIRDKGEAVGCREMRKHLCRYIKGMDNSSSARVHINNAESADEVISVLEGLILRKGQ